MTSQRARKRFEVQGVDTFEATSGGDDDGTYSLAWFDDLEDALRYARNRATEAHDGADPTLSDSVRVFDHVEGRILFAEERPPKSR